MNEREIAELAVKVAEMIKAEVGSDGLAFEVLNITAGLLLGSRYRLRLDT